MADFAVELKAEMDAAAKEHLTLTKVVTLQVLEGVTKLTAVDTGRARNNWQASVGAPATGEVLAGVGGSYGAPPSSAQYAQANGALAQLKPFGVAYVSNNLEYISYLENGTDRMAPQPMVRPTIDRINAQFP